MADVAFDLPAMTPSKRGYDGEIIDRICTGMDATSDSTNPTNPTSRDASPAPSTISSLTELSSVLGPTTGSVVDSNDPSAPPQKKRKLTFIEREAEKAIRRREKEEKEKVRAEEKARKDEEKKQKLEEKRKQAEEKEAVKRVKDLEKAEKQKVKDAEKQEKDAKKQEKDAEKARKEADKLKKERAQMRLGAFFGRPAPASTPPATPDDVSEGASSRRSSIASIDIQRPILENRATPLKATSSEYNKWILPFFVPEHTELAPVNKFKLGRQIDFDVSGSSLESKPIGVKFPKLRRKYRSPINIKVVIEKSQRAADQSTESGFELSTVLDSVPYKYLRFREDVRPPYQGTYTRIVSPRTSRRISRNPFTRELPDTNYDYDSEAEWEPPGDDDEDLNDDDEMSEGDENEEEMEDFLDDADDIGRKKGPVSDMQPVSSGLCWEGETYNDNSMNLIQYKIDVLHDLTTFPIDPFATNHWSDELKPKPSPTPKTKTEPLNNTMQPPRLPLTTLSPNTITSMLKKDEPIDNTTTVKPKGKTSNSDKPTKLIEAEFLPAFKMAIDGSDLTKAGLIEILKKQFPKCSKDAIKDTLGMVAVRVGKKEADKKWELIA